MRFVHFLGFYPEIGGPVRSTGNLIKSLKRKGVKCRIVSPLPPGYEQGRLEEYKMEFDVVYYEMDGIYRYFPSYSSKFSSIIEEVLKDVDIIHLHGVFDYYTYYVCTHIKDKPVVLSPRGSIVEWGMKRKILSRIKKNLFLKSIGKKIFDRADKIHLTGEYEEREFERVVGSQYKNKIVVIPNGINLDINENINGKYFRGMLNIGEDKKIILFVGRITPEKGLDILIPAFCRVIKEIDNLLLVIAGPDEKGYKSEIIMLIDRYKISDKVVFTGMIDGNMKWSAYKSADIFVLPSYTENFGMTVIEAMACGLPVVVSDKVGITREIKRYDAGIIVKTDVDSVYRGLKYALETDLSQKVENAQKMVKELYDIDKVADKMIEMYEEIVRSKK